MVERTGELSEEQLTQFKSEFEIIKQHWKALKESKVEISDIEKEELMTLFNRL